MRRVELVPADVSGEALNELKQWLGIARNDENSKLVSLLRASLNMCEGFTGQVALEVKFDEIVASNSGWIRLRSKPVKSITAVAALDNAHAKTVLAPSGYTIELCPDGTGQVQLTGARTPSALQVTLVAGMAAQWSDLPDALRHGIIRLAAHHYRERDDNRTMPPPASVTALWRPWQKRRLV